MATKTPTEFPLKGMITQLLIYGGIIFFIHYQCTADDRRLDEYRQGETDRKTDIQQAINDGDFSHARKRVSELDKWDSEKKDLEEAINRAEIAFLINSGGIEQAYNAAQEQNRADIFSDAFMPALSEIYEKVGKIKTLQYLTKVDLGCTPDLSEEYVGYENEPYNDSATKYNTMLEQFIVYVDILNDKDFATQLLRLIKPIVVELPKRGSEWGGVKLSNQPQEDIKKKLGL